MKQVAGRAGRYGSVYPAGLATGRTEADRLFIQEALSQDTPVLETAGLGVTVELLRLFAAQYGYRDGFEETTERPGEGGRGGEGAGSTGSAGLSGDGVAVGVGGVSAGEDWLNVQRGKHRVRAEQLRMWADAAAEEEEDVEEDAALEHDNGKHAGGGGGRVGGARLLTAGEAGLWKKGEGEWEGEWEDVWDRGWDSGGGEGGGEGGDWDEGWDDDDDNDYEWVDEWDDDGSYGWENANASANKWEGRRGGGGGPTVATARSSADDGGIYFSEVLGKFAESARFNEDMFHLCDIDEMEQLARTFDDLPLPLDQSFKLALTPLDANKSLHAMAMRDFAIQLCDIQMPRVLDTYVDMLDQCIGVEAPPSSNGGNGSGGGGGGGDNEGENGDSGGDSGISPTASASTPGPAAAPRVDLHQLESLHQVFDSYLWLCQRFPEELFEVDVALDATKTCRVLISQGIDGLTENSERLTSERQRRAALRKLTRGHVSASRDLICYQCGNAGHMARDCTTRGDQTCYNCGRTGHIARDCPGKGSSRHYGGGGGGGGRSGRSGGGGGGLGIGNQKKRKRSKKKRLRGGKRKANANRLDDLLRYDTL